MATTTWHRVVQRTQFYDVGWFQLASIPSGSRLQRIRWSWGFAGDTPDTVDYAATARNLQVAGICTTIGNGTEIPPHPRDTPGDVAPPTQRWLWWEVRQPVAASIDHGAGTVSWRDSGAQETPDVKVQVLATGIPGGQTLNVWFSYQSLDGAWDAMGHVEVWTATSLLFTTP